MTIFLRISFIFLATIIGISLYSRKYANPYLLVMIFGKKGSGKTTLLTKLAIQHLKNGWNVYSTVEVPGTILFNVEDIGKFTFPEKSAIFIDEVGIIWDNRNFKNFRTDVRDYFKFQRQYKNKVFLFSQTFDVDLKLRNLTDAMYLCQCHMNIFSFARRIKRTITLTEPVGEAEAKIADSLEFVNPIWQIFGTQAFILTFIPNWIKYFKSFDPPKLPFIKGVLIPWIIFPKKIKIFIKKIKHRLHEDIKGIFHHICKTLKISGN